MNNFDKFKQLLAEMHEFPTHYNFKFIVTHEKKTELISLLIDHEITERISANGKYISITSKRLMESPDHIIDVYVNASKIEGIMTL